MARAKDKLLNYAQHTTSDSDIIRRKLLLIDIAPCRASGISSTDEELEYANKVAGEVKLFLNDNEFPHTNEINEAIKVFWKM